MYVYMFRETNLNPQLRYCKQREESNNSHLVPYNKKHTHPFYALYNIQSRHPSRW